MSEADDLLNETFLTQTLGNDFERLIGPAFQGCLEPKNFRHVPAREVRLLSQDHNAAYQQMRAQCSAEDNTVVGTGLDTSTERMGYFQGPTLVAVAGYRPWTDLAGDPCILSHPDYRGRGYGTAVTSAVVQNALKAGKLLLYQTLEANAGAIHIARKLGYEQYARYVAVRLRNDAPSAEHT